MMKMIPSQSFSYFFASQVVLSLINEMVAADLRDLADQPCRWTLDSGGFCQGDSGEKQKDKVGPHHDRYKMELWL